MLRDIDRWGERKRGREGEGEKIINKDLAKVKSKKARKSNDQTVKKKMKKIKIK